VATDTPDRAFTLGKGDSEVAREKREKYPEVSAVYFVVKPNGEQLTKIRELVERRKLRPVVQKVVRLRQAMEAYREA
jgi:Zinc-binding dehydrogenase